LDHPVRRPTAISFNNKTTTNLELEAHISKAEVSSNRVIPRRFRIFKFFMNEMKVWVVETVNRAATKLRHTR